MGRRDISALGVFNFDASLLPSWNKMPAAVGSKDRYLHKNMLLNKSVKSQEVTVSIQSLSWSDCQAVPNPRIIGYCSLIWMRTGSRANNLI